MFTTISYAMSYGSNIPKFSIDYNFFGGKELTRCYGLILAPHHDTSFGLQLQFAYWFTICEAILVNQSCHHYQEGWTFRCVKINFSTMLKPITLSHLKSKRNDLTLAWPPFPSFKCHFRILHRNITEEIQILMIGCFGD